MNHPISKTAHSNSRLAEPNCILELKKPAGGLGRARKVVTRSRGRSTGKYPSWKMGRMVQWESPHELNAYRLLDCDPRVIHFQEQPYEIKYTLNGEVHRHYPDIHVRTKLEDELWEVKTQADSRRDDVLARTKVMSAELPRFGFRYRVVVAEELGLQPALNNALLLLKYGRADIDPLGREQLRIFVGQCPELTWGAVTAGALGPKGRQSVCRLVLEGVLALDHSQPIGPETRIFTAHPLAPASMAVVA